MRYFLDTKFIENGKTIDLISIGLVCEDGREYYAGRQLPFSQIRDQVLVFIGDDNKPIFWGESCEYDWVAFCQLFGAITDLPENFPNRCRDIDQLAEDELGILPCDLPPGLGFNEDCTSLLGAKTVRYRYAWLERIKQRIKGGGSIYQGETELSRKAKKLYGYGVDYATISSVLDVPDVEVYIAIHTHGEMNTIGSVCGYRPNGIATGSGGVGSRIHVIYG